MYIEKVFLQEQQAKEFPKRGNIAPKYRDKTSLPTLFGLINKILAEPRH
ncbi:MAG: hypothetical protein LBE12_17310 [Planctomycetaceae bacterium]|nr:hypothetical protein [Planctomycetaceae bacterium]